MKLISENTSASKVADTFANYCNSDESVLTPKKVV